MGFVWCPLTAPSKFVHVDIHVEAMEAVTAPVSTAAVTSTTRQWCGSLPASAAETAPEVRALLDATKLRRCALRRPDVPSLASCANLAVAATGSESLTVLLHAAGSTHAHHAHRERIQTLSHRHAKCFIATIRDPAERLESGFRFDANNSVSPANSLSLAFGSLSAFLHALRNDSSPLHARARLIYERSVVNPSEGFQRTISTSPTCWAAGQALRTARPHASASCIGSNFLVPQVDYLRGADCARLELHLLCTPRLSEEWSALRQAFDTDAPATPLQAHRSSYHGHHRSQQYSAETLRRSRLTESERAYVRECLYPHDTRLYGTWCGADAARHDSSTADGAASEKGGNASKVSSNASQPAVMPIASSRPHGSVVAERVHPRSAAQTAWQALLFAHVDQDAEEQSNAAAPPMQALLRAAEPSAADAASLHWLDEVMAVAELTHSLRAATLLREEGGAGSDSVIDGSSAAIAGGEHNATTPGGGGGPSHLSNRWEARVQTNKRKPGSAGVFAMEDLAETSLYGLKPFAGGEHVPASAYAAYERGLYASLNYDLADLGPTGTMYGDVSAVLRRDHVAAFTILSPVDTGVWWQLCGEGYTWTRWLLRRKYAVNCSAVAYPTSLGTLSHHRHTLLAATRFWQSPSGLSLPWLRRRWAAVPWGAATPVPNAHACAYLEALVAGRVDVRKGVLLLVASLSLFGTPTGSRLRDWAIRHGRVLTWSLGPLANASCGGAGGWKATSDVLSIGFDGGARSANSRLLDPTVISSTAAGHNLSTVVRSHVAAFEAMWQSASAARVTCGEWWQRLTTEAPALLVAPLVPGACHATHRCVGVIRYVGCVCYPS